MTVCNLSQPIVPKIHDQQLLTLRWRSFPRQGRERYSVFFAYNGRQWFVYDCLQPVAPHITKDTRLTIVDAQLTLIFKLTQGACLVHFCLRRLPIICLWRFATCRTPYYWRYTTNNHWCSIDAHFQDQAASVSLSFLPNKLANNLFMTVSNLSHPILPKIHDQQTLTLRWHSFSR